MMTDDMNLKRNGQSLKEVGLLSRHLPKETRKTRKINGIADFPAKIRIEVHPKRNPERYQYTSFFGPRFPLQPHKVGC
jgi:hypothetical protein